MARARLEPGAYQPTHNDRVWLSRAVEGEGAPERLVAQALVNRFMWLRERDPKLYPTLADFVRAYAQPINPRWMQGGDKFEARWRKADAAGKVRLRQQNARRQAHSTMTDFSDKTEDAVHRALTAGPVDLPSPDTTDYSAANMPEPGHLVRKTEHVPGRNTFYAAKGARGWKGYGARVAPALGGAGALVVVLGLYLVTRK